MKSKSTIFFWSILGTAAAVLFATLLVFNFANIITWTALNYPFQNQWTVVQLSDGEILYGHLAGVSGETIGLSNVYSLQKFSPAPTAAPNPVATSSDFGLGQTPEIAPPSQLIPVSNAGLLFIQRTSVLYFKFLPPNDPAIPYLK